MLHNCSRNLRVKTFVYDEAIKYCLEQKAVRQEAFKTAAVVCNVGQMIGCLLTHPNWKDQSVGPLRFLEVWLVGSKKLFFFHLKCSACVCLYQFAHTHGSMAYSRSQVRALHDGCAVIVLNLAPSFCNQKEDFLSWRCK